MSAASPPERRRARKLRPLEPRVYTPGVPQILTVSEMKCARRCAREHRYSYEQRVRLRRRPLRLAFGTYVHLMLEAYWLARQAGRLPQILAEVPVPEELPPHEVARAHAMTAIYQARWNAEVDLKVLGVEVQFRMPLIDPASGQVSTEWVLGGKIDAAIRWRGVTGFLEHKTSSEPAALGSLYRDRLSIDAQLDMYYRGFAAAFGTQPEMAWYDVLVKPGQRPRRATPRDKQKFVKRGGELRLAANQIAADETPDEFGRRCGNLIADDQEAYYQVIAVPRTETQAAEFAVDTAATARAISRTRRLPLAPRNPEACERYGSACDYLRVCTGAQRLGDPDVFRVASARHEELEETTNG